MKSILLRVLTFTLILTLVLSGFSNSVVALASSQSEQVDNYTVTKEDREVITKEAWTEEKWCLDYKEVPYTAYEDIIISYTETEEIVKNDIGSIAVLWYRINGYTIESYTTTTSRNVQRLRWVPYTETYKQYYVTIKKWVVSIQYRWATRTVYRLEYVTERVVDIETHYNAKKTVTVEKQYVKSVPYIAFKTVPYIREIEILHPAEYETKAVITKVTPVTQSLSFSSTQSISKSDTFKTKLTKELFDEGYSFKPTKVYSFTPAISGYYNIETSGCDTVNGILSKSGTNVSSQTSTNINMNEVYLSAGSTYKLTLYDKGSSKGFSINIEFHHQMIYIPSGGGTWVVDGRNLKTVPYRDSITDSIEFVSVDGVKDLYTKLLEDDTTLSILAAYGADVTIATAIEGLAKAGLISSGIGTATGIAVGMVVLFYDILDNDEEVKVKEFRDKVLNGEGKFIVVEYVTFNGVPGTHYEVINYNTYKGPVGVYGHFE